MTLTVIILTYYPENNIPALLRSLENELKNTTGLKWKIIVVDNASLGSSVKREAFSVKNITMIQNKENVGFAGGCNIGIKRALKLRTDAILLLNQDTKIQKGFLQPLLKNKADIVSPVITFQRNGVWYEDWGGKVNWLIGRAYHLESRIESLNSTAHSPTHLFINSQIEYVSGCCMLIKRRVIDVIGLFDERFFLYFEDVDFCLRARQAGFTIAVEPASRVVHFLSEGKNKPRVQRMHLVKSNALFIRKWIPRYRRVIGYWYLSILALKLLISP